MPNRLANETSPYLRQHADNPVDWYPWGPEALKRARAEDKPILLSIGYSACHWCHVMEHESFEDEATAALMNEWFVNVKVDREERPDLDDIYMQAVQAFTGGHGGWPMTLFLTPDGEPFFGGTYFPPEPRHGMPSFQQVLRFAHDTWLRDRGRIRSTTAQVVELLSASGRMPDPAEAVEAGWLDAIAGAADDTYDADNGGFGTQPKFPPHGTLEALLAHWRRTGRDRSLQMVTGTLDGMMRGGMYDIVGGGFCRYSVDARWQVPHFEKMLYDNALLAPVYADAWRVTGNPRYARVARETLDYVLRDLRLDHGGMAASEDADSDGHEGSFYVWTPEELAALLGVDDGIQACLLLGITQHGTFERGTSVLRTETFPEDLPDDKRALYDKTLTALRAARADRTRPARDDKAVAAWNGLALSALARVGAVLGEDRYIDAARGVATFLLEACTVDGRLMRTMKDGVARIPAFSEDYAAVGLGLLDLWEATFEVRWLEAALATADTLVELFWDPAEGGLFFTGNDAEPLVVRSKRLIGGAEPSGNGMAAWLFARLSRLSGRGDLEERSRRILSGMQALLKRAPRALGPSALAAEMLVGRTQEIGIVGTAEDAAPLLAPVRHRYDPFRVIARVDPGAAVPQIPWMADKTAIDGAATAYVCEGWSCRAPTTDPAELAEQLDALAAPTRAARVGDARVHAPELPADARLWLNASAPLSLSSLEGQVVVLDFWTYCCVNCMHVLPVLDAIEDRFAGEPVVVIGVHSAKFPAEKERENVARAIRRHRIRHPVVLDGDHALWDQYAIRSWPSLVVLDTRGRIAWHRAGEIREEELADVVERLLQEGRDQGTVAPPLSWRVELDERPSALSFPGKVAVWPTYADQAKGADPFGPEARLYIADTGNHRIIEARLSRGPEGWPLAEVTRIFGDGTPGTADGATPRFNGPQGIERRGDTLYVADTDNQRVRAIDLSTGHATTIMGSGKLGRGEPINPAEPLTQNLRSPWDVSAAPDVLFVAMAGAHQIWLYMDEPTLRAGPFIGNGSEAHVDGDPAVAALAQPSGIQVHGQYLFWVDAETSSVRMLNMAERQVGTVVGRDLFDFGDVDGEPKDVLLQHPLGITVAEATVYVADTYNNKVKAIDMSDGGRTRTLAGGRGVLTEPGGLAVAGPFLIVADTGGHRIRAVSRHEGEVRTVLLRGLT